MSAPVLVTGTAGGVGAVAIAILRHRGFQVTASTGRPEQANHLKGLGGDRHHRTQRARKTAGKRGAGRAARRGQLDHARQCAFDDAVRRDCGLAGGMDLPTSVAPFILRGASLLGIGSVRRAMADRRMA
jgi:acrylyl-CoA reductase (NADPH)